MVPMYSLCDTCGKRFQMTPANTVVHVYLSQPWMSWLQVICEDGHEDRNFMRDTYQEVCNEAAAQDIGMIFEQFIEPELLAAFEQLYKLTPLREHPLTSREDTWVQFFHYLMEQSGWEGELGL
jgi:hypothetical protein